MDRTKLPLSADAREGAARASEPAATCSSPRARCSAASASSAASCRGVTDVPKSGHQRSIPLTARPCAPLSAIEHRPRGGFVTGPSAVDGWHEDSLTRAFVRDARRADVERHSLHSLRHAFVTRRFREGGGAPTVPRLAGHEHLVTTQRCVHAPADRPPGRRRATRGFTNGSVRGKQDGHGPRNRV